VEKKLPNLTLLSPSLSVRVIRIPDPIAEAELPKCWISEEKSQFNSKCDALTAFFCINKIVYHNLAILHYSTRFFM